MAELLLLDYEAVLEAISPVEAIELVRDGFVRHASGEWEMPPKQYLAYYCIGFYLAGGTGETPESITATSTPWPV